MLALNSHFAFIQAQEDKIVQLRQKYHDSAILRVLPQYNTTISKINSALEKAASRLQKTKQDKRFLTKETDILALIASMEEFDDELAAFTSEMAKSVKFLSIVHRRFSVDYLWKIVAVPVFGLLVAIATLILRKMGKQ